MFDPESTVTIYVPDSGLPAYMINHACVELGDDADLARVEQRRSVPTVVMPRWLYVVFYATYHRRIQQRAVCHSWTTAQRAALVTLFDMADPEDDIFANVLPAIYEVLGEPMPEDAC